MKNNYILLLIFPAMALLSSCSGDNLKPTLASSDMLSAGTSVEVNGSASTGNVFNVEANCPWTVTSNVNWIHITSPEAGQGNGNQNIVFDVDANSRITSQTGQLTITTSNGVNYIVSVNQLAGDVQLTANPSSLNFTYEGGEQQLTVTSNTTWTATSSVSWLTINGSQELTVEGDQSLTIQAEANTYAVSQTGVITLSSVDKKKTISVSVTIDGCEPALAVTTPAPVSALGGNSSFSVSTNSTWEARIACSPTGNWARFQNGNQLFEGEPNANSQDLRITVDPNTTENERTINISLATTSENDNNKQETLTIKQAAGTRPNLSQHTVTDVSYNSATFSFTANTTTFDITECGVIYSEVEADVQAGTKVKAANVTEDVTLAIPNLKSNSTYYVCAYATNAVGVTYSDVISFTTGKIPGRDDNDIPEYE